MTPTKIIFVCHGNICRSPMGASIFQKIVNENGHASEFEIDSAATSTEEIGNPIYPPMMRVARNYNLPLLNHRARQITKHDVDTSDLILIMDYNNKRNLLRMFPEAAPKTELLRFYTEDGEAEIEDPWYTGNYQIVFNQIFSSCQGLYKYLLNKLSPSSRQVL